jgi:hypothetical protein
MENENTGKKLVVTSISHNSIITTDKHAVWKRKTLYINPMWGRETLLNIFINYTIHN